MIDRPTWFDRAACIGKTELFFPADGEEGRSYAAAKAICATCPCKTPCLERALDGGEYVGVWGGLTPRAIEAERRSRGLKRRNSIEHGTRSSYQKNGCRCEPCVEANAYYVRIRRVSAS